MQRRHCRLECTPIGSRQEGDGRLMRFATFTAGIRKALESFSASATERITDTGDSFDAAITHSGYTDYYLTHAWVNIAIGILMRNIGRTEFVIKRNGERIQSGPVFSLFDQPSRTLNRFDLWKETGACGFLKEKRSGISARTTVPGYRTKSSYSIRAR